MLLRMPEWLPTLNWPPTYPYTYLTLGDILVELGFTVDYTKKENSSSTAKNTATDFVARSRRSHAPNNKKREQNRSCTSVSHSPRVQIRGVFCLDGTPS